MRMAFRWSALVVAGSFLLAGCSSNPADDVTGATVSDAEPEPIAFESDSGEVVPFGGETSKIDFVGSKVALGSHDGGFNEFEGEFSLGSEGSEVQGVNVTIDMDSTWSDNAKLTGHLKNEDFFEVETYPTSKFVSTAIKPAAGDGSDEKMPDATHEVTGNLTLHGVTKSITFPAKIELNEEKVQLASEFFLNREDFDIVYGSGVGDNAIRSEVVIKLNIDAPRGAGEVAED